MRNASIFEDLRIFLFHCDHTIMNEICNRECLILVFRIYGEVCICSHTHAHGHVRTWTCTHTNTCRCHSQHARILLPRSPPNQVRMGLWSTRTCLEIGPFTNVGTCVHPPPKALTTRHVNNMHNNWMRQPYSLSVSL